MGYIGGGSSTSVVTPQPAPSMPRAPKPEIKQPIDINIDPTNPVETVAEGIGNLFTGVVRGAAGAADFLGGVPVIGDVGRAIAGGIGAVGEIGLKGTLQVKDIAKGALDLAMIPGQVVQTGAAAVRASGIFGDRPDDVKNMMASGKQFGDVVDYLVKNNRAFSDNTAANLGFALVTDPLNYVPIAKPFTMARSAAGLAKVEATALSKADELIAASKAGKSVSALESELGVTVAGKRPSQIRNAVLAGAIDPDSAAFLERWRIPGALYDATVGKLGRGFSALTSAMLTPVFIGATKELRQAPRLTVEFFAKNGRPELADNLAGAIGRGLNQTMIFTIGKLFNRSTANVATARANRVISIRNQGRALEKAGRVANGKEWAAAELKREGLSSGDAGSMELLNRVWEASDDAVRAARREWIDAQVRAEVRQVGAEAGGNWQTIQKAGGVRMSDSVLEASSHISEGAYKLERLSPEFRRTLFIEKGAAAVSGNGKKQVANAFAGNIAPANPEATALLSRFWDETVSKMGPEDQARYVQLMEIAAYGNQGTNAAIIRTALSAVAKGDEKKLAEIIGTEIPAARFAELRKMLSDPANAKYTRINLVKADSLTKERLEALRDIATAVEKGEALPAGVLASLPDEFAQIVGAATTPDQIAVAIASYFPDFGMIVNRAEKAVWAEMKTNIDEMIESGNYVVKASADEVAEFQGILNKLSPGSGAAVLKSLESGRYSLGFAPESGVRISMATKVTDDAVEYVPDAILPFIDSTANLFDDSLELSANSFNRSGIRQMADKWLSPVSSRAVQNEQISKAIRLAQKYGGTEADGRRALAQINEEALRRRMVPRALIMDENFVSKTLQSAFGPSVYSKMIDDLGDPRKALMIMYAGSRGTVGVAQNFTGWAKTKVPALAIITDYAYPQLKFRYNPFFFVQEYIESPFFNRLRGINRTMTSGEYKTRHGWIRALPYGSNFLESRVAQRAGISQLGEEITQPLAATVLGDSTAALTADLDVVNSLVALGGAQIGKVIDETANGAIVRQGLAQGIKGRFSEIARNIMNPYPMKMARREEAALSMAIDDVAANVRTQFPRQWTAATRVYGTNNPKEVLINLIRDAKNGYINPVRVLDGNRPPGFGFSAKGSPEAASALAKDVSGIKAKVSGASDEAGKIAAAKAESIILKDAIEKSAALGNDVSRLAELNVKLISAKSSDEALKIIEKMSAFANESQVVATQSLKNYDLLVSAIKEYPELAAFNLKGFTRESLAASLANFRKYGGDFPGLENALAKLQKGQKLDAEDLRAVQFGMNKLIGEHGFEEVLLSALRVTLKDTADAANRIHFYNPNRSAFERSLNHPVLGLYPLSYMAGKVVPELARAAFVKMPFSNKTRPFAGYEMVREAQDHLATWAETDPEGMDALFKSDAVFMFKQLFPAVPGDVSVTGPKWLNAYLMQLERAGQPPAPGREPAQADPFYALRALAEQGATQNVYGVLKRFGGVGSEVWDYFDGPVDYVEPNK